MSSIPRPDLSARPLQVTCEYTVNARPEAVYAAWTTRFDTWFAQAGTVAMVPEPTLEGWLRAPATGVGVT